MTVKARLILPIFASACLAALAPAQQATDAGPAQPQVKVNMLNVCTPSAEEQKEIAAALARIPKQPLFSQDFEISHGVSTLTDAPNFLPAAVPSGQGAAASDEPSVARYVRIRREFAVQALFSSVQYSFSDDGRSMVETLVLHVRDPKDLIQVSMEDSASSLGSAASMVGANTPVNRIRLERFGKSSIALARCNGNESEPGPDQSVYEPLFRGASEALNNYRRLLGAGRTIPAELAQIPGPSSKTEAKSKSAKAGEPKN